jgi:hypothetical protein
MGDGSQQREKPDLTIINFLKEPKLVFSVLSLAMLFISFGGLIISCIYHDVYKTEIPCIHKMNKILRPLENLIERNLECSHHGRRDGGFLAHSGVTPCDISDFARVKTTEYYAIGPDNCLVDVKDTILTDSQYVFVKIMMYIGLETKTQVVWGVIMMLTALYMITDIYIFPILENT